MPEKSFGMKTILREFSLIFIFFLFWYELTKSNGANRMNSQIDSWERNVNYWIEVLKKDNNNKNTEFQAWKLVHNIK